MVTDVTDDIREQKDRANAGSIDTCCERRTGCHARSAFRCAAKEDTAAARRRVMGVDQK